MIFAIYPRVIVKLGDERYEFERSSLRFTEVVEIENASGLSFGEWQRELGRHSIRALAALLHVLRKRAGVPSDFETLDFAAYDLDVIPLREDGSEMNAQEVAEDITRRAKEAAEGPTAAPAGAPGPEKPITASTPSTSLTLPSGSASAPGNGNGSPGKTSKSSKRQPTRT